MPTKYNTDLISSSWNNFMNYLIKARKSELVLIKEQLSDYNSDYTVKRPQQRTCQQLDQAFEFGILKEASTILYIVSNMS